MRDRSNARRRERKDCRLTETAIVTIARRRAPLRQGLSMLLRELDVTVVPFTIAHYEAAARAYERFGRGRHEANLNSGTPTSNRPEEHW